MRCSNSNHYYRYLVSYIYLKFSKYNARKDRVIQERRFVVSLEEIVIKHLWFNGLLLKC